MAKRKTKRTQARKQKGWLVSPGQVDQWLDQATHQLLQENYPAAVQTCQRLLRYAPPQSKVRGEVLERLATAYVMLKQFEEAYQVLSEALAINPDLARLWYNRGLTGRYTMRLVQAARDLEKAVELETDPTMREKFAELLAQTSHMAEQERALRGPDFTLDQLLEQQELFSQSVPLMQQGEWAKAEAVLRRIIAMADCLPQPQGNLGLALLMQQKYDEAEVALKRALEIDPTYDLARQNLAMLPLSRQSGQPPAFALRDPMAEAKIGLTVQWVDDDD